MTAKKNQRI
jgi:hypothetical protein